MRRYLSILALAALLAVPSLSIAKNPFDFSDWVRKSRTETWTEGDQSAPTQPPAAHETPPSTSRAEAKNYGEELFGDTPHKPAAHELADPASRVNPWYPPQHRKRLPDPVDASQGRPRLEERPTPTAKITREDLHSPSSGDTLQRFDEFLKSQKVVNAGYENPETAPSSSEIQQVSDSSNADDPWGPEPNSTQDVESSGYESELPPQQVGAGQPTAAERFSFVEEDVEEADEAAETGSRLTESIPTTPASRSTKPQPQSADSVYSEVNPFAIERPSAQKALPAHPMTIEPASDEQQNKSRFSITRTPRAAASETPPSEAEAAPAVEHPTDQLATEQHSADQRLLDQRIADQRIVEHRLAEQRNADISAVWNLTGPLNVGQECPCELVITNLRKASAEDVSIDAHLPETLQLVDAAPAPVGVDGVLRWELGSLEPGQKRTINVVLVGTHTGPVELAARVHFAESKLQSLTITEPQLSVEVSGPKDVTVGEPATQTVTVRNPGSGVATNVKLEARVPEGLEHVRGSRLLMNIGSLNPGESRRVRLALAAISGGQQILQVEARADAGLVQAAAAEVTVVAPELKASISGPGLRYLGREATYTLRVENVGEAETDAVQMVHHVPEGFDFIRSDRGAQFDESSRMLTWFVGRLGNEQPQELQVTLMATAVGEYVQAARATSAHGSFCDAQLPTRVEGTASLVLEVDDLDDPVEVGRETAYEVTITNEGTASSRDVALACELPEGLTFLNAEGPSEHRTGANSVSFQPVAEVAAGESLTYRVFVKGTLTGDKRFRCRLTSAHLSQPLFTEEFTKFYGE